MAMQLLENENRAHSVGWHQTNPTQIDASRCVGCAPQLCRQTRAKFPATSWVSTNEPCLFVRTTALLGLLILRFVMPLS